VTTQHRLVEFADDAATDDATAVAALDGIADGRGWCNLTPEVDASDVDVLTPSVFSLRIKRGAPVASLVTSPPRKGERRPATLGVLHTRGRLGKERIDALLGGAGFTVRQDHTQRGLLLEVPPDTPSVRVLEVMRAVLSKLCDYDRTGRWRLDVFERA
jgi:hypothetical protein